MESKEYCKTQGNIVETQWLSQFIPPSPTEEEADANYYQLIARAETFKCSGSTLTISLLVLAACLLLGLAHYY